MIYSNINYLKLIIDEGIRQTRFAQLSGARHLKKAIPENLIYNQIKLADQIESLRRLGLTIGDVEKTLTAPLLPPKIAFDEASIKKLIKHKLSLRKCDYLVSTVDEIDFSEIVSFYSGLASDAELAEKLLPFLENKRLEINKAVKNISRSQKLALVQVFKAAQDEITFIEWSKINTNTSKDSKSRTKKRLIERGLITPNPTKPTKQVKLTHLGKYAARRILATETVNFLWSTIDSF